MSVAIDPNDFFSLKPPKRPSAALPVEENLENVSWKSIRPTNSYETVRKMFILDQKKRKFADYKRQ